MTEPYAWLDRAKCRGSGVEFVDADPEAARALVDTFCGKCYVLDDCRALADSLHPRAIGVWAGELRNGRGGRTRLMLEDTA